MQTAFYPTVWGVLAALAMNSLALNTSSAAPVGTVRAWRLVWSDEFNGPDGSAPDPAKWTFELGGGGWGNNELETYTSRRENSRIQGGKLVIEARRETFVGTDGRRRDYTSARLKTQGNATWTYARVEARIKVPAGQGLWPAFWMLGANINQVGWPNSGEVDIMENIGREPSIVHGTAHGPGYSGGGGIGKPFSLAAPRRFEDDFHLFAVEWDPGVVRWSVDNQVYFTITPNDLPKGTQWVFDQPQFLLLNVAVGGSWPGAPDASTVFPQQMLVDYVRVYARTNAPAADLRLVPQRSRDVVFWPDSFPHAQLEKSMALMGPWELVTLDGVREEQDFVANVGPGFYRLFIAP